MVQEERERERERVRRFTARRDTNRTVEIQITT
jgi:hypothetical protein